jgi:siroheme synthase (precorrin-2 oxidase/ferrochelatase)
MSGRLITHFVDFHDGIVVVAGATLPAIAIARRAAELGARVRLVASDAAPAHAAGLAAEIVIADALSPKHLDGSVLLVSDVGSPADGALAAAQQPSLPAVVLGEDARVFLDEVAGTGRVQVAVTTEGAGAELERFASILASIRGKLEERFPDESDRMAIWEQILDSPVMILLESGHDAEAVEMAERMAWGTG